MGGVRWTECNFGRDKSFTLVPSAGGYCVTEFYFALNCNLLLVFTFIVRENKLTTT